MNLIKTVIILGCLVLISCKGGNTPTEEELQLPDDFLTFFEKFHMDSAFQMERVIFPLEGVPSGLSEDQMVLLENFKWTKEMWVMHKPFRDEDNHFNRHFEIMSDGLIVERISVKGGNYGMERRFAKLGEEWYLIYYSGMNKLMETTEL